MSNNANESQGNSVAAAIMRGHANIADAAAADLRAAGIPATTLEGIALAWRASADSLDSTPVSDSNPRRANTAGYRFGYNVVGPALVSILIAGLVWAVAGILSTLTH